MFTTEFVIPIPKGSGIDQSVTSTTHSIGFCIGIDGHSRLALGRCFVARPPLFGGSITSRSNWFQGRICGSFRVRRGRIAMQSRDFGFVERSSRSRWCHSYIYVSRILHFATGSSTGAGQLQQSLSGLQSRVKFKRMWRQTRWRRRRRGRFIFLGPVEFKKMFRQIHHHQSSSTLKHPLFSLFRLLCLLKCPFCCVHEPVIFAVSFSIHFYPSDKMIHTFPTPTFL